MENIVSLFIRNTDHIVLVENNLKENLELFFNYYNNKEKYYESMYNFFKKKKDAFRMQYYMERIMDEKEIVLNGKKLTESQFNEKKKEIETQKGMLLIEVSPGVFKTRLNDWQKHLLFVFYKKGKNAHKYRRQ